MTLLLTVYTLLASPNYDEGESLVIDSAEDVPVPWDVDPWWQKYKHDAFRAFAQVTPSVSDPTRMISGSTGDTVFVLMPQRVPSTCDACVFLLLMCIVIKIFCAPKPKMITVTDTNNCKNIEV